MAGIKAHELRRKREAGVPVAPPSMSTVLASAGVPHPFADGNDNDPLCPPLELATTYSRPADGNYGGCGKIYGRTDNATRELLEETMGRLETLPPKATGIRSVVGSVAGGDSSPPVTAAFSSGMAACTSVILAHPSPLTVLIPDDVYHGLPTALHNVLQHHGVRHEVIDMASLDALREGVTRSIEGRKNVVVWMETPSNPLCCVTDIRVVCDAVNELRSAEGAGWGDGVTVTTVVDSTWAPPCITQPLLLGADAALHSGTKYLNGHSDVLLGIITCSPYTASGRALGPALKTVQTNLGAVASPFDSYLTLRGLRTLQIRVERMCQTASKLAEFLAEHPLVKKVHYPGLRDHPQHDVAKRQMNQTMFGGMLSFEVANEAMAMAAAGGVRMIRRGTSLGGTETLIEHRASIEPPGRVTSPLGLLRVSAGLEDPQDLMADLDEALKVANEVASVRQ